MVSSQSSSSNKNDLIKAHLRNLVALAKADEYIAKIEREFIFKIGDRNGLTEEEVELILEEDAPSELAVPSNDAERFDNLFDLVHLMLHDGVIYESEIDFCILIAERLGFDKKIVGMLVRKISLNLSGGLNKESIRQEVSNLLKF